MFSRAKPASFPAGTAFSPVCISKPESHLPGMKSQIPRRLGLAHLRDTLEQFVSGSLSREQAMASLQIGSSRLYELRTSYLAARAAGLASTWSPGLSGGNRKGEWPPEEQAFLRRVLSRPLAPSRIPVPSPPASSGGVSVTTSIVPKSATGLLNTG
jgi:hypothetical protein